MDILFIVKVILEGLAVAIAAFFIPKRQMKIENVVAIALSAAAVFLLLDQFSPEIGASARQGAGFGIGLNQVGWGENETREPFEDCKFLCQHNPVKCLTPGPCRQVQTGGRENGCPLQSTIDVGTNVEGLPVKYGTHCTDYFVKRDSPGEKERACLPPRDVSNLTEPYGLRSLPPQWSQTNIVSRKMNFDESNCPVNENLNEYKVVPGLYSKYALQSGYNENVGSYNDIVRTQDANWLTKNPLDLHHLQPVSENFGTMGMY
jgi:hypothetical protein